MLDLHVLLARLLGMPCLHALLARLACMPCLTAFLHALLACFAGMLA